MLDLIMIVGPTASGKTTLSINIAKAFNGEIINGDAMQFYRGLDIGTAKIKDSEKQNITHHLLDILEPTQEFSVAEYQRLVREKIDEIKAKGKLPIIVGGSGLYLSAVYYDYLFLGKKREEEVEAIYQDYSNDELARILIETKPNLARKTDLSNRRRLLRALAKEDEDVQDNLIPFYPKTLIIGLELERKTLYHLIDRRVDRMIEQGLINEAKALFDKQIISQATQAIGYKELYTNFEGLQSLEDCIALIKRNSRRYAKRQITWFKNQLPVTWFEVDLIDFQSTVRNVIETIKKEVI